MARPKQRGGRTAPQKKNVRLIVLTGIPATGKTRVGDELHAKHGFRHLNFETGTLWRYAKNGVDLDRSAVAAVRGGTRDTVISWGFVPDSQLAAVLRLHQLGFEWIWFDGNRRAAREAYESLGRELSDWDRQLGKIETYIDPRMDELHPRVISVFTADGKRRLLADVISDVLDGE